MDAVRRWLSVLGERDRLVDAQMVELLRLLGRLPAGASRLAVGQAAAELVVEAIDRLKPRAGAGWREQTAHQVLRVCFVDGVKAARAADDLGISIRQLSRERTRAIELLRGELVAFVQEVNDDLGYVEDAPPERGYRFEPIPAIAQFLDRPKILGELTQVLTGAGVLHVHGPAGIGKTSLVAELVTNRSRSGPVLWYRFRSGLNDTLPAILFELGEHLRVSGKPRLAEMLAASLPAADVSLLSRIAVAELDGHAGALVFDDYHLTDADRAIGTFLDDLGTRLPELRLVTVGRHQEPRVQKATTVQVPPLTRAETAALLRKLGAAADDELADAVHGWTGGIPQLVQLCVPWLATATAEEITGGIVSFTTLDQVQEFLLDWLTGLMDSYDRDILEAASAFRDQFTDAALAHVTGRTIGQVSDASRRLVRYHVALRGREGDVAFVHTSIREYVYQRLSAERRRDLHRRAADWYRLRGDDSEARHHEVMSQT